MGDRKNGNRLTEPLGLVNFEAQRMAKLRSAKLSPARRSEIARNAAIKRWYDKYVRDY